MRWGAIALSVRLIGALYLWDFALRWPWRDLLYSDEGLFPASWVRSPEMTWAWVDLFTWPLVGNGGFFLGLGMVCAAALTAGLTHRGWVGGLLVTILVLRERSPAYALGPDAFASLYLFFLMLIRPGERPGWWMSYAWGGVLGVVYGVAGIKKWNIYWWDDGSAIELAFRSTFAKNQWVWDLIGGPWAPIASRGIFLLEIVAPFVLLWPWKSRRYIHVLAIGMIVFHAGSGPFLPLGIFPWLMVSLWLAFLPVGVLGREPARQGGWRIRGALMACFLGALIAFAAEDLQQRRMVPAWMRQVGDLAKIRGPWAFYSSFRPWRLQVLVEGRVDNKWFALINTESAEVASDGLPSIENPRWERMLLAFVQAHSVHQTPGLLSFLCRRGDFDVVRAEVFAHPLPGVKGSPKEIERWRISQVECGGRQLVTPVEKPLSSEGEAI